jgi:N-acetylmuramoyl-L-alanine amidase
MRSFNAIFLALSLLMMVPFEALAQAATTNLVDARIASAPERSRIVFDLTQETGYVTFPMSEPDRLVIDFENTAMGENAPDDVEASGLVEKMHMGAVDETSARAVIFLTQAVQVAQIKMSPKDGDIPARLVIELEPGTREVFDAAVAAALAQLEAATPTVEQAAPTETPTAEAPQASEEAKPEEKLRPLIILDPGHGGIDLGAKGQNGKLEKDIVLTVAKKVQARLQAMDRFDVALTRDDDTFLTLNERVQLARDNQANLFISLHADSYEEPFVRGGSIYTRDENATDILDKVLAENENQSDLVAGFKPPENQSVVVDILVDLMRRETRRQSYVAARQIVALMNRGMPMRPHPLRQADFFVLQAPEVPSVLIELGFLSNEQDLRNLSNDAWQDKVAETLSLGIAKYFDVGVQP